MKKATYSDQIKQRFFRRVLFYTMLFGFLSLVFWIFLFSHLLEIKKINFNEGISEEEQIAFGKAIEDTLEAKILNFIPQNNLILFKKDNIEKVLKDQFKSIKEVVVKKDFPDTLKLEVITRTGQFVFCAQEDCFLVDDSGDIYHQLDAEETSKLKNQLAEIRLKEERVVDLGENLIAPEKAKAYSQLASLTQEELGFELKDIFWINVLAAREVEMETEVGWKIIFSTEESIDEQLAILKKTIKDEVGEKINQLEYIDLRVKGKVFYRLKSDLTEGSDKDI